jgi:hypothetical protein
MISASGPITPHYLIQVITLPWYNVHVCCCWNPRSCLGWICFQNLTLRINRNNKFECTIIASDLLNRVQGSASMRVQIVLWVLVWKSFRQTDSTVCLPLSLVVALIPHPGVLWWNVVRVLTCKLVRKLTSSLTRGNRYIIVYQPWASWPSLV